ncbi:4Fe-4S dicluster domain-containing protein [bacterium]|nr:4Fe-4S dicluster domain-containing protein [bacterium]
MAHRTLKTGYSNMVDRLNRFPQGAPPSEWLYKILKILVSEREAKLIANLPMKPFTAEKAAKIWKVNLLQAQKDLDELASRAILIDIENEGKTIYTLPPPMAGFFEFSMMRIRDDIDQKVLAELFYQYLNVEEDFISQLFTRGETQLGRTFVHEPVLSNEDSIHVLDYERASEVIQTATHMGVGICYCRHKMEHQGLNCDAPMDICMTFNESAASLIRHGHAREVEKKEGMYLLLQAYENNLVQFGENVRERVNFICNCCGCCCEAMIAARRFAVLNPIHTTNFLPIVNDDKCTGCGKCITVCPVEAMTMVTANDPHATNRKKAKLDVDLCLGCAVCVRVCPAGSLSLKSRLQRVITPLNGAHRVVLMAIERGVLQHLIFDNRVMWSHRAMSAVLGVILKLPPVKQIMASKQMKSKYLEALIRQKNV